MTPEQVKALDSIPTTPEAVRKFMAECDAGLHPLPDNYKEALKNSEDSLMKQIAQILEEQSRERSFPA